MHTKAVGSNPTPRTTTTTHLVSQILNVLLHLKKQGYRESTLYGFSKRLKLLAKHVPLHDPELVKEYVASLESTDGYKGNLINAYQHYAAYYRITFDKPYYQRVDKITKVPREEDINKIIAHARSKYALAYSILRDTGMRIWRKKSSPKIVKPVELTWLRVKDVDCETGRLYPGTAKHGAGRVLQLRPSTLAAFKLYIQKHRVGRDTRIWTKRKKLTLNWCRLRKSVAESLGEPRLLEIRLYDLRHFYATRLYQMTKDIIHVQRQLGHKTLQHTLRYVGLVNLDKEEYVVKVAQTVEESSKLLEVGFSFVAVIEGRYVFRRPKSPLFSVLIFLTFLSIYSFIFTTKSGE